MVVRIFMTAIIAGVLAGLFMTLAQKVHLTGYILEAETYETTSTAGHSQGEAAVGEAEAWAPGDGVERTAFSGLANILTAVAFGLLLCVGYAVRGRVDWRQGVLWGIAGFLSFNLAPALGLSPELPGASAAPLLERQVWWAVTVVLTLGGLAVVAFAPRLQLRTLGLVVIALPHIVGAPQPDSHAGLAPADLEQAFIYASLIGNALFWIVLGVSSGYLFDRFGKDRDEAVA
jgi:cobalt transporter subunit CbtA